jgi:hypothetical protein
LFCVASKKYGEKGGKKHNPCKMEPTDAKKRKKQADLLAGWLAGWLGSPPCNQQILLVRFGL